MSNFYLIDGFFKDTELCFYGELATDSGNYDVHCKYPFSDIFAFGFNPDVLHHEDSEFVVTRFEQLFETPFLEVVQISTSSWTEEDFFILSDLSRGQIKAIISPMVANERESDSLLYDNEDYIAALRKAYPKRAIMYYANFDIINF